MSDEDSESFFILTPMKNKNISIASKTEEEVRGFFRNKRNKDLQVGLADYPSVKKAFLQFDTNTFSSYQAKICLKELRLERLINNEAIEDNLLQKYSLLNLERKHF